MEVGVPAAYSMYFDNRQFEDAGACGDASQLTFLLLYLTTTQGANAVVGGAHGFVEFALDSYCHGAFLRVGGLYLSAGD